MFFPLYFSWLWLPKRGGCRLKLRRQVKRGSQRWADGILRNSDFPLILSNTVQRMNWCVPAQFLLISKKKLFKNSFPGGSDGEESACNAGDPSSIPGLVRSPGEWNGYPLQYSCLENCMDSGKSCGIAKSQTGLSD